MRGFLGTPLPNCLDPKGPWDSKPLSSIHKFSFWNFFPDLYGGHPAPPGEKKIKKWKEGRPPPFSNYYACSSYEKGGPGKRREVGPMRGSCIPFARFAGDGDDCGWGGRRGPRKKIPPLFPSSTRSPPTTQGPPTPFLGTPLWGGSPWEPMEAPYGALQGGSGGDLHPYSRRLQGR
nr:hypothetical protein [Morchella crassipes]